MRVAYEMSSRTLPVNAVPITCEVRGWVGVWAGTTGGGGGRGEGVIHQGLDSE